MYPLVLLILTICNGFLYSQRWGLAPWIVITPDWDETATVAILAILTVPFIYVLAVLKNVLNRPYNRRTVILHSLTSSLAATALATVACATHAVSLDCYVRYIFITKGCLPYYWIIPIFTWFFFMYYMADVSEIKRNGKLTTVYTSWIFFLASTPFLAMLYDVFRLTVLGWQMVPNGGDTIFYAAFKGFLSTFLYAALKSASISPLYVLFIPFLTRFERTRHSS